MLAPWKESNDKPRQHIKKQRHYFAYKGLYSQCYNFSSSNVWMWELDNKKGWVLKSWCLHTVVLQKTLESPLDSKEIKPGNPKGNQSWIFIGRTDAEADILWWRAKLCKEPIHWQTPWYWERLKAQGKGDERGWDGWMASPTQWMWVWTNCWRWLKTGKPGMLQSMWLQSQTWLNNNSNLTTVRMAIIKKSTNNMLEWMWRKGIHPRYWCEYKLVKLLWKTLWRFLKELK